MAYGLQNQKFTTRLTETTSDTDCLMMELLKINHFESYEKASKAEDKKGIDYWVIYPEQTDKVPIKFKIRDNPKFRDFPICRFQPLYGHDHEKNTIGRDFKNLSDKVAQQYYVGIRSSSKKFFEVYRVSAEKLLEAVSKLEEEWTRVSTDDRMLHENGTYNKSYFNKNNVSSWMACNVKNKNVFDSFYGQVWWKMNNASSGEKRPKLNMYIPDSVKDESFSIESKNNE